MHTIENVYPFFRLMFDLNWDRLLYVAAIVMALLFGTFLGTVLISLP
ncbi:hypothetical protein [Pseudooceanicola nanhaiensis]|nr:hypothetical protein [Pseudooceanicola nanhaiensis]MCA0919737.1 hypothetical protein [Pseudooceanicola nanhaiensis]